MLRWLAVVRVTALALLFLLPMQMRAGAEDPHPHAMLQLLLDARDGRLDHHNDGHEAEHRESGTASATHEPDVPTVGVSNVVGGAIAMLAALVAMLWLPARRRVTDWPAMALLIGRLPAIDPPPPRAAAG